MSQQVKGLRLRRTQILLREALIELIEERGFDKLTVQELTERAMVSRAAFYRNYQDKYDLVEQIFTEAMEDLFNVVAEPEKRMVVSFKRSRMSTSATSKSKVFTAFPLGKSLDLVNLIKLLAMVPSVVRVSMLIIRA